MADTAAKREADSLENEDLLLKAKRAKCDDKDGQDIGEEESKCDNILSGFVTSQILNDSAREKSIFIHGKVSVFSGWLELIEHEPAFVYYVDSK